jgi:hypothetical protein
LHANGKLLGALNVAIFGRLWGCVKSPIYVLKGNVVIAVFAYDVESPRKKPVYRLREIVQTVGVFNKAKLNYAPGMIRPAPLAFASADPSNPTRSPMAINSAGVCRERLPRPPHT